MSPRPHTRDVILDAAEIVVLEVGAALLAASANDPKLLAPVRKYYREWFDRLDDFGLRFERAAAISLAVDGLWLLELLQLSPLDQAQRDRLSQEIFRLIEEGK